MYLTKRSSSPCASKFTTHRPPTGSRTSKCRRILRASSHTQRTSPHRVSRVQLHAHCRTIRTPLQVLVKQMPTADPTPSEHLVLEREPTHRVLSIGVVKPALEISST
ncbi:hypothetical protein FA95DRAFT_1567779 [Auriscalpium vulgare]|uniref:Uncharacterized protein n=1 Tax=Auriscalpium vulgare TaxID=40419 RepID=A0ACB8R2N3_9AGAM|nr:hypothetical protein FA95DRAFT_1567779 [Auriscalpium vulgare]